MEQYPINIFQQLPRQLKRIPSLLKLYESNWITFDLNLIISTCGRSDPDDPAIKLNLVYRTTIKLGTGSQISFNVHERHVVGKTWVGFKYQHHRELKLKYSLSGQLGAPAGMVHAEITDPSMKVKLTKPSQLAPLSGKPNLF